MVISAVLGSSTNCQISSAISGSFTSKTSVVPPIEQRWVIATARLVEVATSVMKTLRSATPGSLVMRAPRSAIGRATPCADANANNPTTTTIALMIDLQRILPFLSLLVLAITAAHTAHAGSATVQSVDQDVAINRAMGKVPAGKTVTDTSCRETQAGGIGGETLYRCTVTWE